MEVDFAIDRGGTFTDVYALCKGRVYTYKLLSKDPNRYDDASRYAIAKILSEITGSYIDYKNIDDNLISSIRMGTTIATNALLEREGAKSALVTNRGFEDVLDIGYQDRPNLFELNIKKSLKVVDKVVGIEGRLILKDNKIHRYKELDTKKIRQKLQKLYEDGIVSLAIVLLHSYKDSKDEEIVYKIAKEIGFEYISLSSNIMPVIKFIDRADTTSVDAYLTPKIQEYIESFRSGFRYKLKDTPLYFMQSDGGLIEARYFRGANSILSGPAGGVVGYASAFYKGEPLIGFDMGGTSTDVSRYDGSYELGFENIIDGIRIKRPQMDILTVAAGGGSRLFYKNGIFEVGPQSAGADPGPVCYKKGGYLSITDANLVLGRVIPEFFPSIFGKNADEPLDKKGALEAFVQLTAKINRDYAAKGRKSLSVEEVAQGFIDVANESMMKPIKEVSVARGYDLDNHSLVCFGGAGGQHACAIASLLGIKRVYIHRYSGILSAWGLGKADLSTQKQQSINLPLKQIDEVESVYKEIEAQLAKLLNAKSKSDIEYKRYIHLKYSGTDTPLVFDYALKNKKEQFLAEHKRRFGFVLDTQDIIIDSIRVQAIIKTDRYTNTTLKSSQKEPTAIAVTKIYTEGKWVESKVYNLSDLGYKDIIKSPAVILNDGSTIVVEGDSKATIDEYGNIVIDISKPQKGIKSNLLEIDPITLSLFHKRFTSIAQQMGNILQKTAISTNIKERLDYSCAIFDAKGNLVANAPHIPVHLGSMEYSIKHLIAKYADNCTSGDVFIGNDPNEGGSHLPDITVVTPCFDKNKVVWWVASRGHHADIGGVVPGSMPPNSTKLSDEGAVIPFMKIVSKETFHTQKIQNILQEANARNIKDNISDIKAQISANMHGNMLLKELSLQEGIDRVVKYMEYIQIVSQKAIEKLLQKYPQFLSGETYLDDGSKIAVDITIDKSRNKIVFDFSKSSISQFGNQNTPKSVTASAVVYTLRVLIGEELPLNGGFMRSVELKFKPDTILSPSFDMAVVGGNVTTSQRVVDLLLELFEASAHSCGCMNNIIFGNEKFGYYETIGGGAGATPNSNGASAVHTHMTNTRITDVEVLESRYPVILHQFAIRKNSGGEGKFRGGDAIVREFEFLEAVEVSLLTERRASPPKGLKGGACGKRGENLLYRDGKWHHLPPKISLKLKPNERICILTPSGGGWGESI